MQFILHAPISAKADHIISFDDKLVRQAKKLGLNMEILNPVDYIRLEDI